MKLSEMIIILTAAKFIHGDIDIKISDNGWEDGSHLHEIYETDFEYVDSINGKRLQVNN